jgi:hypothetical protein
MRGDYKLCVVGLIGLGGGLVAARTASAAYLVAYEGDVLPTDAGWASTADQPDPLVYTESVANGIFTVDATATGGATVYYDRDLTFSQDDVAIEWRSQTSNDDGGSLFGFYVWGEEFASAVEMVWYADELHAYFDDDGIAPVEHFQAALSEGFHVFRLESTDSLFSLSVDGNVIASVELQSPVGVSSQVRFGLGKSGFSVPTKSQWDYVRISEVPEPACGAFLGVGIGFFLRRRKERALFDISR